MQTQHTPGPWYVFHSAYRGRFDDDGPGAFSIGDAPTARSANILCSRYEWPERAEEMKANAHLMAAAPDLLEALQNIAEYWNQDQNEAAMADACWHAIHTARAAIAKATGERP